MSMSSYKIIEFGKDKSEILRGVAVTLMVVNHSLPGKLIAFAVPLFSFLVGYGYAFARQRDLRHAAKRVWHLLANFWIVLFGICLPVALYCAPQKVAFTNLLLNMFGLNPDLNFFCWYIYFYIFCMAVMAPLSRLIDRFGWKGLLGMSAVCGLAVLGISFITDYNKIIALNTLYRCLRYLPIVLGGYWVSSNKIYNHIQFRNTWWMAALCAGGMVALYFLRGIPYAMIFDFAWAPIFAGLMSVVLGVWKLKPIRFVFSQLGKESMHIWFLHALFFTHATRGLFFPLIAWVKVTWIRIVLIIAISYLMAKIVDKVYDLLAHWSLSLKNTITLRWSARE